MLKARPFLVEALTAIGLLIAPFILPHLGFAPNTVNRILVWGLFGIGFDILFDISLAAFFARAVGIAETIRQKIPETEDVRSSAGPSR